MVVKISENAVEIRGYIKTHCQLGVGAKQIHQELSIAYGFSEVSYYSPI